MRIVLDTNIFCEDYWLRGVKFRVLLNGLKSLPGSLLIPEVVIDELVNRFREDLREAADKEVAATRALSHLLVDAHARTTPPIDHDSVVSAYRSYVTDTINAHGKLLEYPNVSHKNIVARDLARKKPFKRDGSGYRDLLIWESIKNSMVWGTERILFLTNNPKDFGEGPRVDPQLQEEIVNPDRLTLVRSLQEFNDRYVVPNLELFQAGASAVAIDLTSWLNDTLLDALNEGGDLGAAALGFPVGVGSVHASEIVAFRDVAVGDSRVLDSGEKLVSLTVRSDVDLSIDVHQDDTQYQEVYDAVGGDTDFVWCSWHQVSPLCTHMELIVSSDGNEVESYEITGYDC